MESAASVNERFAVSTCFLRILSNEIKLRISGSLIVVGRLSTSIFVLQQNLTIDVDAAVASIDE